MNNLDEYIMTQKTQSLYSRGQQNFGSIQTALFLNTAGTTR